MKQLQRLLRPAWAAVLFSLSLPVLAQGPARRLAGPITGSAQTVLAGSQPARVKSAADLGAVSNTEALKGITLVFSRSAAQEADLQTLLAAQGNPASPLYHQWLTPEQFAARFGVADADISAVENWLQSEGFSIDSVSRSRTRINFSGNAGQVAQAFGAPLHHFNVAGVTHTAPSKDLALPATLAPMVTAVLHLSDFHPQPALRHLKPTFTSGRTGTHYLTPLDLATMYDVSSVYSAGFNGAGQSVAIVGQSAIDTSDISRFQTAEGLSPNLPTVVLMPGTGVSAVNGDGDGQEAEADIDLEYASGMARGAQFFFVYTGDDPYYGAFDALNYAVDQAIAPIISSSYGDCEADFGSSGSAAFNQIGEQANSQGQTIFAASGDAGSPGCAVDAGDNNGLSALQLGDLGVDVPASLPTVTGVGGTQMIPAAVTAGTNTYWTSATGSDVVGSLLSYVPEVVWNEDSPDGGLASSGGGTSGFFPRPSWQTSVPGIPAGTLRLVPDLALQASAGNPGFILCTSDPSVLQYFGITNSCTSGFRDASGILEANYGGTSFAAPVMAGLMAVLNQATHSGGLSYPIAGQGNINPTLYALASNPTTYASVFHDITTGTNACVASTEYYENGLEVECFSGSTGYASTAGYDEATGLGSIDFAKLVAAWPVATAAVASKSSSTTVLTAANATVALNSSDLITITVGAAGTGTATPTGAISLIANGAAPVTLQLTNGQATFTLPGNAVPGSYVVEATYTGDSNYLPSSGDVSVTAGTITSVGTFTLAAQSITVAPNNVGSGTVQITPGTGYTGAVNFSVVFPSGTPTLCYEFSSTPISTFAEGVSTGPQTTTLEIGEGTVCQSTATTPQFHSGAAAKSHAELAPGTGGTPLKRTPVLTAFAGLFLAGLAFRRRSRRLSTLLGMAFLAVIGLGLSGCGSGGATIPKTVSSTNPQTYTVTVVGTDSVTSSITASTTFTLTVQ